MATVTKKRITPKDLLSITDRLMPELVNGRLVERETMGQEADAVAAKLIVKLGIYAEASFPGVVNGAQGSYQIFPDDPNKVRIADASFTCNDRLPQGKSFKRHGRVVPDLVVEVISPRDLVTHLFRKLRDYFSAGIPLIWIVHPDLRAVQVYRPDGTGILLNESQTLYGGNVLPGFSCEVASLFASL